MKDLTILNRIIKELQNEIPKGVLLTADTRIKNNDTERSILRIDFQDDTIPITEIGMDEIEEAVRNNEISEKEAVKHVKDSIKEAMNSIYGAKMIGNAITRDSILETVLPVIVNDEQNTRLKEAVPHRTFLDLMIYYEIELKGLNGHCAVKITNNHLKQYNITEKELADAAENNLKKTEFQILDCTNPMSGPITRITDETTDNLKEKALPIMIALLKGNNYKNANVLLCNSILNAIANKFKDGFWILPSSIHEIIITHTEGNPDNKNDWNRMDNMIKEINTQIVSKDEVLSDHAYYYDRASRTIFQSHKNYTSRTA